jgi:hypothetical protein
MIILSTLRYGETAYGSVSKEVERKLEPIHHIEVRLVLKTFALCKTKNVLCEAGLPKLTEMRYENTMKTRIRILTNKSHPTRSQMIIRNIYNDYVMNPRSPKTFFILAAELIGQIDIDEKEQKTKYSAPNSKNW